MFEETLLLDNDAHVITLRPMDPGYILDACPAEAGGPLVPGVTPGNEKLHDFHLAIMRRYRNCAILAWDDDRVVGYVTFYPEGLLREGGFLCPTTFEGAPDLSGRRLPILSSTALEIGCLHVVNHPDYRQKGIGTALVGALVRWARFQGWHDIKITGPCLSGLLPQHWAQRQPPLEFWRQCGFTIANVSSDDETRANRRAFVRSAGFPQERQAFTSHWKAIFRRYELVYSLL